MVENTAILFLSERDTIEAGLLDLKMCVDTAEEVFRLVAADDYRMGGPSGNEHGQRIFFPETETSPGMPVAAPGYSFMAMPAYAGGRFRICGEKWYGANVRNLDKGLPRAFHMVMLNDAETGRPLCLLTATLLSAVRSGAAPGVAARHLGAAKVRAAAMIGAGLMNRAAMMAFDNECANLEEIRVYDILAEKCAAYCEEMQQYVKAKVRCVASMEDAFDGADLIHTGQSKNFHIKKEWLKKGALLLVSSFLSMDEAILTDANIIFDHKSAHDIWLETDPAMGLPTFDALRLLAKGEIRPERVYDLGEIVAGQKLREAMPCMVFYWMGMSVADIALAADIYARAKEKGIGTLLPLWDEPFWK